MKNCTFLNNHAYTDSAISAEITNTSYTFSITESLFQNNYAISGNTISFKNSSGTITLSRFYYNTATIYSKNIFLSFSTVNITSSVFTDHIQTNPY